MSDWQPIETAPKETGRPILVFDSGDIFAVYWSGVPRVPEKGSWELCGHLNYDCWERNGFDRDFQPTHWMELPEAPHD